jgi:hypothetical protein
MLTKASKNLLFAFPVFVLLVLTSCQKGVDIDLDNPPPLPDNIKDSTELIKSIRLNIHELSGQPSDDSAKEDYFYDTINKKIIITYDHSASNPDYYNFSSIEHSYDNKGLLTNVIHKYRDGFVPLDNYLVSVKLDYDAEKIIRKLTIQNYKGDIRVVPFTKTSLSPDKYELSWDEPLFTGWAEDTINKSAIFSTDGRCLRVEYRRMHENVNGEPLRFVIYTDSLIYDVEGNIKKVQATYIDTTDHEEENYLGCEFFSHYTKGDQLYKQKQLLLNGIANMPFGEDLFFGSISGILSYFSGDYESMQYHKYPFQTAKVYGGNAIQYRSFKSTVQFDSKDRLTKFTGFFNDIELFPYVFEIGYYK